MLSKIQKKLWNIKCTIDILSCENEILTVKGWIFSPRYKLENVCLVVSGRGIESSIPIKYGIKRLDVYQTFQCATSKKSGFFTQILIENLKQFKTALNFEMNGKIYKLPLGCVESDAEINLKIKPRVQIVEDSESGMNIVSLIDAKEKYSFEFPEEFYSQIVDIIVPVYNGYQYLETLLKTIELTKMKYRLILINDKSPDERVGELLEEYAADKDNVILINNEENLGFLQTVNKGFGIAENHVALVNTDVELPNGWLERLMLPIFKDSKIASSTPYTNCGTLCSFPNMGHDNELFMNYNVQELDDEFSKIPPRYEALPTGVGFCMGMNRDVLEKIGMFDAENFGKGYGEENDWCQRAIQAGYKNVHVENLYVYHKHGGSFLSEDKKRFLEEHEKILLRKHPYYNKDVARFCTLDPNKEVREFVKLNLIKKMQHSNIILAFDHDLGGGATKYLIGKGKLCLNQGNVFIIVRFDYVKERYKILYYYDQEEIRFYVKTREDLFKIMDYLSVKEIWINEMVTYPDLYETLSDISSFSKKHATKIKMLIHDFFAICPTINLLDYNEKYCYIPSCTECNQCLKNVKSIQSLEYKSMEKWRKEWGRFLENCTEIIAFSNDSKEIIEKAFGKLDNISVIPHEIDYIPVVNKKCKTTETLNIGLLGVLTKHKGRLIVRELIKIIEDKKLPIRVTLIGSSSKEIESNLYKETGAYTRDSIPRLILENDIDIFLIPSIWPETFSYTTEEIMHMQMPVMCFDIGAPAERVKRYDKGYIIPEISAQAIIDTIEKNLMIEKCKQQSISDKKVLFVVEEITFSSRYRVDHLREQLLQQGFASDCITIEETLKYNVKNYESIVIYRSSKNKEIESLVKKAHQAGKKVYYDIDDYIFEYSEISDLKFLQGDDYIDFDKYSTNIKQTMELCDGYIVSTNNLEKAITKSFPNKPVVINRNVASMEMVTISLSNHEVREKEKIRLGYFSGSKTHNEDFEGIKEILLKLMKQNENVILYIGGQIELSSEFNQVKERIEKFDFVSWKKLPNLIAKVDINLMPLEDSFFHACKSENKWMEAALVKVPTIASWNSELANAIRDGETGYLCKNLDEWECKLQNLIEDEELRTRFALNAHEKVMKDYTTYHIEQDIIDLLLK